MAGNQSQRSSRGSALVAFVPLVLVALLLAGCTSWRATTLPLDHIDKDTGYRPDRILSSKTLGDVALVVSFSGGGTRAAALAYAVLEELRGTQIVAGGAPARLLDEIDVISSGAQGI